MPIPTITHNDNQDYENLSKWLIELDIFNGVSDSYPDQSEAAELKKHADSFIEELKGKCKSTKVWFKLYELQILLNVRLRDSKQADFYLREALNMLAPGTALESISSGGVFKSPVVLDFLQDRIKTFAADGWTDTQIHEYYHLD